MTCAGSELTTANALRGLTLAVLGLFAGGACGGGAAASHKDGAAGSGGTTGGDASAGGSTGSHEGGVGDGSTNEVAPAPTITSFARAEVVIGQPDFTSNTAPTTVTAAATSSTSGSAAFDGVHLFLPDPYEHRVLGFDAVPTTNGAAATMVLGQASLTTSAPGATAVAWYLPQSAHTDGTTLAIAESGGNAVLLLPTTAATGASAAAIVGWPDLATPSNGCAADRLDAPASAFIGGGHLLVTDRGNNRVLIWNTVPTTTGVAADLVLGQTTMTSCVGNDSQHDGTVTLRTAATLRDPYDAWTDGTRILVADHGNNRVLVWSTFPKVNGVAADLVLGQKDPTLARDTASNAVLSKPASLAYGGGRLWVADAAHNRVLGWSTFPTVTGAAADVVLGQADFTHVTANDDGQLGKSGAPTARTLAYPSGIALAGDDLVVSDTLNRRFLIFRKR